MSRSSFGMVSGILAVVLVIAALALFPIYRVWSEEMRGRAELARAEQNRQIARLDAQAEIERARGVAEANRIIAEGLGGPDGYLRYLWINQLSRNGQNVIYVPTEAGLPILEAGQRPAAASQNRDSDDSR
ncbi:MAG: hypothetical protein ACK4E3_11355 [Brevundimonas sp.]|jgi:hypothetical protein|uniref:hypothetical protein n=1 Tax=Brevundimonas sp. TaxID=1871086 RepID=UPI00391B00AA